MDEEAPRKPQVRLSGLAGIILAAGASSRMGTDKALLQFPGTAENFLSAQIASLRPHCEIVLIVAGRNATALKPDVYRLAADLIINPDPDRGQFSSLQVGLQEMLNRGRDLALITHVDRMPPRSQTIHAIKDAFGIRGRETWMVVPEYNGAHGHPVLAGREMIEAWLRAPVTSTAREVEHAQQHRIAYVAVDDADIVANINTPEDYERLKG
jgi:molybdenum cofactor cytidylyltransferase